MQSKDRSLTNPESQEEAMQLQIAEDRITRFVQNKFRVSRSYPTMATYRYTVHRFFKFLRIKYNLEISQLLIEIKEKKTCDPLEVLDNYYTYLSNYKLGSRGYQNSTIVQYITIAKEFLNGEGCKIYHEDLKQRFRLPKISKAYEKGLTKEILNRLIRFANPKLATAIILACTSGLRIAEMVHLRVTSLDFTTNPTTIIVKAETTKTRETRITHTTFEGTKVLQDYISRMGLQNDDFLFFIKNEKKQDISDEEFISKRVRVTVQNLERQLGHLIKKIPELSYKNDNGRNAIHFHSFRAWMKTQITLEKQSDFSEALLGHHSLKLVYFRQNDSARRKTYLSIEHALTLADTEKIDQNFTDMQKDNLELRGIVDSLSKQLRNLENRIKMLH